MTCSPHLGGLVLDLSCPWHRTFMQMSLDLIFASCMKAVHFLPILASAVSGIDIEDIVMQWYNNVMV